MPKDPLQLQNLIRSEILQLNRRSNNASQYGGMPIPSHSHENISSIPVRYSSLKSVQYYLTNTYITLTSAQILTLNTAPVVLLSPPTAPNTLYIVQNITAKLLFGTTAYAGTHDLEFHYNNGSGQLVTDVIPPTFMNSTTDTYYNAPATNSSFIPVAGGSGVNGQIVAFVNTANPTAGNGTIDLITHYHVATFTR